MFFKLWSHSFQDEGVRILGLHEIIDEEPAVTIYQYARLIYQNTSHKNIFFFVMVFMGMCMKTVVHLHHCTIKLHSCDVNLVSSVDL